MSRVRYVACAQGGVSTPVDRKHGCHWGYVCGPNRGGAAPRTMVWICEYPYRTVRLDGPCDDCVCHEETTGTTGLPAVARNAKAGTIGNYELVHRLVHRSLGEGGSSESEGGRLLPFKDNK